MIHPAVARFRKVLVLILIWASRRVVGKNDPRKRGSFQYQNISQSHGGDYGTNPLSPNLQTRRFFEAHLHFPWKISPLIRQDKMSESVSDFREKGSTLDNLSTIEICGGHGTLHLPV